VLRAAARGGAGRRGESLRLVANTRSRIPLACWFPGCRVACLICVGVWGCWVCGGAGRRGELLRLVAKPGSAYPCMLVLLLQRGLLFYVGVGLRALSHLVCVLFLFLLLILGS
jgi:hypothetical protein